MTQMTQINADIIRWETFRLIRSIRLPRREARPYGDDQKTFAEKKLTSNLTNYTNNKLKIIRDHPPNQRHLRSNFRIEHSWRRLTQV